MLIATTILLILFGKNIPPYITYVALFLACMITWQGSGLPIWAVTVSAAACWCVVEVLIARIGGEFKLMWKIGNFRLAIVTGA